MSENSEIKKEEGQNQSEEPKNNNVENNNEIKKEGEIKSNNDNSNNDNSANIPAEKANDNNTNNNNTNDNNTNSNNIEIKNEEKDNKTITDNSTKPLENSKDAATNNNEQSIKPIENNEKSISQNPQIIQEIKIIEKPCEKCPDLERKLAEEKSNSVILIQTTKQIFLKYLDDPMFMDIIQNAFVNSKDNSKFLDQILNLTELLEKKLSLNAIIKVFKDIPEILKDIESFNLKVNLKEKLNEYQKISEINALKAIKPGNLIEDLLKELVNYTKNLLNSLMSSTEKIEEVKLINENKDNQIVHLKSEMDEIKTKLQNKTNEGECLKKNVINLNNQIELLNKENQKFINDKQKVINEKEDTNKNLSMLNEKIAVLNQQLNLFKIENTELSDKASQITKENEEFKKKIEILNKNIGIYKEKFIELEKNNQCIKDLQSQMALKDAENEKIKTKYIELEKYFEDSKTEKAKISEDFNQILADIKAKNEEINKENFDLKNELTELKKKSSLTENVNEKYQELEKNYLNKELEFKSLKENYDKLKKANEEIILRVNKENLSKQSLVDKAMLKSLVVKYFDMTISSSIKVSLLETIANFLEFDNNERIYVGLQTKKDLKENNQNADDNVDGLAKAGNDLYNFITKS